MNLTQVTARIGREREEDASPLLSLIKDPKKVKEKETPYILFMTIHLDDQYIRFDQPSPYNEEVPKKYYYFGNNSAQEAQVYLVREVDSLHYLLTSVWGELIQALEKAGLKESRLYQLLQTMKSGGMILEGGKKGKGVLDLSFLPLPQEFYGERLRYDEQDEKNKKKILIGKHELSFEAYLKKTIGDERKENRYVLVIPRIMKDHQVYIPSQMEDYHQLIKKIRRLEDSVEGGNDSTDGKEGKVCYICHQRKADVSSDYTTKFLRSGINKFFVTKKTNFSRNLVNKESYDDNYAICSTCYQDLLAGEKRIERDFRTDIAGENVFILPEGLFDTFSYEALGRIKRGVDLAFQSKVAEDWFLRIEAGAYEFKENKYTVNMIFYRTDGNSVSLLEAIEDVPTLRYLQLMERFRDESEKYRDWLTGFSMGTIYRMVPIHRTKDGTQTDVKRVLSLYHALLSGYIIEREQLFRLFSEAMEKGIKQLQKEEMTDYINLELYGYRREPNFYIRTQVFRYILLFHVLQEIGLLDQPIFHSVDERSIKMDGETLTKEKEKPWFEREIDEMEEFLNDQGFSDRAKALFYLGSLVYSVGKEQERKGHQDKPILKKISFQGMNVKEIIRLYEEVVEKLRQYDAIYLSNELRMNRFHRYFGNLEEKWELSDHANLFYLMAGYAYQVKWRKEEDLQAKGRKDQVEGEGKENDDQE